MRNYLFALFATVFFVFPHFSYAQEPDWKWQNPIPTANLMRDIQFLDSQIGWAVGDAGTILKTNNGGQIWQSQSIGMTKGLSSVHFTDTQNGWVVGDGGIILKTSDGGSHWLPQTSSTNKNLSSVNFIDTQTGWTVGDAGIILKTSNGGNSWQSQVSGTIKDLNSVYFQDSQTGWTVGNAGTIRKTSNGGQTWQGQSSGTTFNLFSVHFSNAQIGWVVGETVILYTTNSGQSWQSQGGGSLNALYSVHFRDIQTGWGIGAGGTIMKTSDGGQTWETQSSGTTNDLYSVHFSDSLTGWAVGDRGIILKTNNGGSSWQSQNSGRTNQLNSVYFTNSQTGWAVGNNGAILATSNKGQIWQSQSSGTLNPLRSVHFIDAQTGWVVGGRPFIVGTILKTSNGGQNWETQNSGTINLLNSVYFSDNQTGWTVGDNGTILKTNNGGQTWQAQTSGTTEQLKSVHFEDAQTGWVVGNSTVLKTSNGGQTWQSNGTAISFTSVHFIDSQTGWGVCWQGEIRKTTNGGQSWQTQNSGTYQNLFSVHFSDSQTGLAVGDSGTILKTNNGGTTWVHQNSGTINWLNSVHSTDAQTGWAVGVLGTILTTITNNYINPETLSTVISGKLFEKTTVNCNPSNIPVPNRLIKTEPGPYYGISGPNGNYEIRVPLSAQATLYTLKTLEFQSSSFQINVVCPADNQYSITVDTIADTLSEKNFGFEITPCHHLDVQIGSSRRRRCFENTTSVSYLNQGSLAAPDAYILVEFPHWVRPVSASRNYIAINDSVWRFNLDTVSEGESGSFTIIDSVLCGNINILGLSECTKATIYPAPNCPSGSWNGASLFTSGKCVGNGKVLINLANRGTGDMQDSTSYRVYLDSILVFQKRVKLVQNDSLLLQVQADGKMVHLEADQVADHPTQYSVVLNVEGCALPTQTISTGFVNKFPQPQSPNSKIHCLPIRGAYDPNDKAVVPQGFTSQHVIPFDTRLEYLIRFQNTGTDTAFTVYVIDTLDGNLNPETLEMGAVSHNYELSMQTVKSGKTFLRWQFNNIQLPDSGANQLKSNGFIQYRISPKANLILGSQVRNNAEIYFDFNPPVITNQTLTTYNTLIFTDPSLNDHVQIVTALPGKLSPKQLGVNLYPNPVTDNLLTANFSTKGGLALFNAQGTLVYENQSMEAKQVLHIHLKTGFYMAQIRTAKGFSIVKIVVE